MRQADRSWWPSGSFEGRALRDVLKDKDFGAVFRFLKTRGWSRAAIAAATELTETRVRAIAQGKQRITSYEVIERIAEGLDIERGLMGLAYGSAETTREPPRPSSAGASLELPTHGLASIRLALDAIDLPPDGPIRPMPELSSAVASVVRLRLASNYLRLCAVLPDLLNDLHRAHATWQGQRRTAAAALLAQAYRAADALAVKSGSYDLSARIIWMMADAARQSGDEVVIGAASYVRGELFFANGRPDLGRALLERAAERLVPEVNDDSGAAYGSLHMRAAVLAGQASQLGRARDHLTEAAKWAAKAPEGEYHGTAFGPSSVRIHEVTLAVDTDDPDGALRAAHGWDPSESLPAERRSHFYIDVARAHSQLNQDESAVIALFQARAVAPEHTRFHPKVREMIPKLLAGKAPPQHVREFARWAAVPAAVR